MDWFYLALAAPLLYAVVNLFDDNLLQFVYKSPYLATTFSGFFGAVPLVALTMRPAHISGSLAALAVLTGFLTVCYYFFYFKGLESDMPSVVIALFSLAPATIPVFARIFVHERLTSFQLLGFALVLLASLAMATIDIRKLKFSAALLPVVIAVILMDVASILSKHLYQQTEFYGVYMGFCAGMGLGGVSFLLLKFRDNKQGLAEIKKGIRKVLPFFVAAEAVNVAAEFTLNLAISNGPVSLVKAIEGIQPMFVLAIAIALYSFAPRYFREAEDPQVGRKLFLMFLASFGLGVIGFATR